MCMYKLLTAATAAVSLLAGCGVGLQIGVGDDDGFDDPPAVSLVVATTSAAAGGSVQLAAAASDDIGVAEVSFWRLDASNNSVLLCTDTSPSYDCATTLPADAQRGSSVQFFARAVDSSGQRRNSATVGVTVL